ncbi:hypothetical protein, partial [Xenophilus sp.]|uniref:hypothetical protein n=1 Tax=Xenophilus sp. TaxID=1873499 RepID=UPI0037DD952A
HGGAAGPPGGAGGQYPARMPEEKRHASKEPAMNAPLMPNGLQEHKPFTLSSACPELVEGSKRRARLRQAQPERLLLIERQSV